MITNKQVIDKAKELGFNLVGFTPADELNNEIERLSEWLENGFQAGMAYMEKNIEKRKYVSNILSSAKSVISLALNYYNKGEFTNKPNYGKISRYAWGKDYHLLLWEKLDELTAYLKSVDNSFDSLSYTDTGPVMDKAWAVRSGLGWMGKHSNIITKEFGSWIFLSTIITNYEFDYSTIIPNFCGSCTKCIDACPTSAIIKDFVVDANRCISYLTIENKGEIADEFYNKFDQWIFGCDVCQDVCPWNKKFSIQTAEEEFLPVNKEINLSDVINMNDSDFKQRYKESPIKRTKLKGIQRNAKFLKK